MIKKILQWTLIGVTWLLFVALPVYAVSQALYVADVVVTNNGTAASEVCTTCNISTQALIDGKFATSDLKNTALQTPGGTDIAYMPGVGTNPWIFFVPSIGASEQKSYLFYTGGPAMQTGFMYFPASGGMTTSDNASLELGDNFTIEQKGWVDTSYSANKTLVYKEDAFKTYISAAGNITSVLYNSGGEWVSPTGHNDPSGLWQYETLAYDEDTGTKAYQDAVPADSWSEFLELSIDAQLCEGARFYVDAPPGWVDYWDLDLHFSGAWHDLYEDYSANLTWVEVELGSIQQVDQARMRGYNHDSGGRRASLYEFDFKAVVREVTATGVASGEHTIKTTTIPQMYLSPVGHTDSGSEWSDEENSYDDNTGTKAANYVDALSWSDYLELSPSNTITFCDAIRFFADYTTPGIDQIDVDVKYEGGWNDVYEGTFADQIWVQKSIPAGTKAVSSARMRFYNSNEFVSQAKLYEFDFQELAHLDIYIDDVLEDSAALGGISVPDNSNDWTFLQNGAMPYLEYHKIWVDGTLKQHIMYERDTTFSDQSGNGNDATPTFRTTPSDADVSATLSNFRPIEESELTGYATEGTPELLAEPPEMPSEMYSEGETEHLPGAALVNTLLDTGGIPHDLFWIPFCYGAAAVAALISYRFVRSMLIISIIAGVVILFFALTGVIPLWTFILFAVIAVGINVAEKVLTW